MGKTTDGLIVGVIAGFLVGLAGATKDAPFEGFKINTFWRSPVVGAVVGALLNNVLKTDKKGLFLATIGGERAVVEAYKIIRVQKPGKFDIGEWGVSLSQLT